MDKGLKELMDVSLDNVRALMIPAAHVAKRLREIVDPDEFELMQCIRLLRSVVREDVMPYPGVDKRLDAVERSLTEAINTLTALRKSVMRVNNILSLMSAW